MTMSALLKLEFICILIWMDGVTLNVISGQGKDMQFIGHFVMGFFG